MMVPTAQLRNGNSTRVGGGDGFLVGFGAIAYTFVT